MAAKPTIALARFADTGGADKVAPSSGLRDTGFVEATPVDQSFVNELLFQLYSWALYLNDGSLSGNHSIAGTLATTGALTVGAAAIVTGALTIGGQALVVADFTYTADAGTDTLTKTAHTLETGDGPMRTTNSGGGLPGGLAINTDYFVIRTGANTFQLATSRANALAGSAINITSNGTGTQTLIDQAGTTRVTDATVTRDLAVGRNIAVTGSGTVAGSLDVDGDLAASQNMSVSDDLTVGGTLSVGQLITASAGVTAAANQHVTVSGTGRFKHGLILIPMPLTTAGANAASGGVSANTAGLSGVVVGAGASIYFPLPPIPQHTRIVNVSVYFKSTTDRTNCTTKDILQTSAADPATDTLTSAGATFANNGTAISRATNINAQSTGSRTFWLRLDSSSSFTAIAVVIEIDAP